ncbi:pilus (MSHA type) biogenesis protein MshL [Photobacterium galatheae]|uniref:MSHA biogenesis protein MshL n=1 Tax=Photobacterium galatheae TaxID=1654360 RepID=A0A066RQT1_9GAMM|nr:pilus (MSHA type) biogenesis protein MshL [Photobacterium galatheae]KDM92805.1 MSHA biogenesis protein MshL [Photobacterium galatheae]MCM0149278.1 pilus (MSHA type) biogenesis protein MshL [Photobacterium galatheae]
MRLLFIGIMTSLLTACSANMGHHRPVEVKEALNQAANEAQSRPLTDLPSAVSADLMPSLSRQGYGRSGAYERRFRVNARGVEARAFFSSLVHGTVFNMVIHPNVSGRITLSLQDVTLDEVLDVVSDMYGYNVQRKGNIIQVFPATLRTEVIPVDYLQLQRRGISLTSLTTGSISDPKNDGSYQSYDHRRTRTEGEDDYNRNGSSERSSYSTGGTRIETRSESDFWNQLQRAVQAMIGPGQGRSIVVSPQASLLTVKAFPNELREVREFLGVSKKRLQRQVVLEAKIMEVTLSDSYQQGINWRNITKTIGGTGIIFDRTGPSALPGGNEIANLLDGQTNITISDGNFSAVLSFLETQGDLNVLSSPRVTAANNQKAVIKVGGDQYFVTEVDGGEAITDGGVASPNVVLTPFFSGISLDVTPQIDDDGGVLLHVHPTVVEVTEEIKDIALGETFGTYSLPLAKSSVRESDSVIHASSGDVVVIGGLMKSALKDQETKVPFLGDIPGLGYLFRNINQVQTKTELVILLKPTVVGEQTWQQEIERSRSLVDKWFPDEG